LDSDGKQLLQWPIDEIESLRRNEINHQELELKKGDLFEIKGIDTLQVVSLHQHAYLIIQIIKVSVQKRVMRVIAA
jgi:hypothetical protein